MLIDPPALGDISQAITEAMAPAFLLAAISGFLSLMAMRLSRIQDQSAAHRISTMTPIDSTRAL